MKSTKVYKVVHRKNGELFSAMSEVRSSSLGLKYEPNKLVKPIIGFIFCWDNLTDAKSFAKEGCQNEVWEAEAYGATGFAKRLGCYPEALNQKGHDFWRAIFNNDDKALDSMYLDTYYNRDGVLGCRAIKLTKLIKTYDSVN